MVNYKLKALKYKLKYEKLIAGANIDSNPFRRDNILTLNSEKLSKSFQNWDPVKKKFTPSNDVAREMYRKWRSEQIINVDNKGHNVKLKILDASIPSERGKINRIKKDVIESLKTGDEIYIEPSNNLYFPKAIYSTISNMEHGYPQPEEYFVYFEEENRFEIDAKNIKMYNNTINSNFIIDTIHIPKSILESSHEIGFWGFIRGIYKNGKVHWQLMEGYEESNEGSDSSDNDENFME